MPHRTSAISSISPHSLAYAMFGFQISLRNEESISLLLNREPYMLDVQAQLFCEESCLLSQILQRSEPSRLNGMDVEYETN